VKPKESSVAFEAFVQSSGAVLSACSPSEGFAQMFSFYQSVAPEGCGGSNGDMLLYQWGTHDWGSGPRFELNITRQFTEQSLEGDDAISQLSLTFEFEPNAALEALGEGNRWCEASADLPILREFAFSSPPFAAVATQKPASVKLTHSYV
jgi:hypothetical protein